MGCRHLDVGSELGATVEPCLLQPGSSMAGTAARVRVSLPAPRASEGCRANATNKALLEAFCVLATIKQYFGNPRSQQPPKISQRNFGRIGKKQKHRNSKILKHHGSWKGMFMCVFIFCSRRLHFLLQNRIF